MEEIQAQAKETTPIKKSDTLAVWSFVSSFFTLLCWIGLPIALITGIVALSRNRFSQPFYRVFSILGLCISVILSVLLGVFFANLDTTPKTPAEIAAEEAEAEAKASADAKAEAEAAEQEAREQAEAAEQEAREEGRLTGDERDEALAACKEMQKGECVVLGWGQFNGIVDLDTQSVGPRNNVGINIIRSFENVSDKNIKAMEGYFLIRDPFGDLVMADFVKEIPQRLSVNETKPLPAGEVRKEEGVYRFSPLELDSRLEVKEAVYAEMIGYETEFILERVAYEDGTVDSFE